MDRNYLKQLLEDLIIKEKWSDFLRRFINVLRINIFVVDYEGKLLISPYRDISGHGYGIEFLDWSFNFDFTGKEYNMLDDFSQHGAYAEAKDSFDLHVFSIPIKVNNDSAIAHLIIGPVILNKKWESADYLNMANRLHLSVDDLIDRINEVRVVSFVSIKAILDLLSKVVKDIIELNLEMKRLHQDRFNKEIISKEISEAAQDLYATIHLDELLITILDVALNLCQAESGSIMILDEKSEELRVKVSRGMEEEVAQNTHVKIGDGVAGLAAKENTSFVITGREGDNRIKPYLRRGSIVQSMVVPLASEKKVFGVLNLHTERPNGKITTNVANLEHLSKLISTVMQIV